MTLYYVRRTEKRDHLDGWRVPLVMVRLTREAGSSAVLEEIECEYESDAYSDGTEWSVRAQADADRLNENEAARERIYGGRPTP